MRIAAILIACATCGCDAPTATAVDAHVNPLATLVHSTVSGPIVGTSAVIPIPTTTAGNQLVVAVMQPTWTAGLSSVTVEEGNRLDPWFQSIEEDCPKVSNVWISGSRGALPLGITSSVTVTMTASDTFLVYVLEISNTSSVDTSNGLNYQPAAVATAPSFSVEQGELIVSTIATCTDLTAIAPTSPFTSVGISEGFDVAYYTAPTGGAYDAAWNYGGGSWAANTVSFR